MEKSKDPEVIMGGLLGSGSFAKVYKAHKVDTSEAVATKVFDKDVVRHGRAGEARTDWGVIYRDLAACPSSSLSRLVCEVD
jgi:5'-AMP-activated protein kinase, catalytic alpha subunit